MSYVPTLPAAAGMCVGIVSYSPRWIWLPLLAAATGVVFFCISKYYRWALFLVAIGVGAMACDFAQPPDAEMPEEEIWRTGTIASAQLSPNAVNCVINLNEPRDAKAMLSINTLDFEPYQPGASVLFKASLEDVSAPDDVPWQINPYRHLRNEGIGYHAFVMPEDIRITRLPGGLRQSLNSFRNAATDAIVTSGVDGPTAAFLLAVTLGNDVYVAPSAVSAFRMSGVAHLLAISGLHVGIIASIVVLLLLPLSFIRKGYIARSVLAVALIWGYAALVGFTPSILRASVMFTVYMFARLLERDYIGFNSLFLSVIIILLIKPTWLFTPGFQLSVMSVAAIFGFLACLPQRLQRRRRLYYLVCLFGVPISAILGSGIAAAWMFGFFPGAFLATNIICAILFPWIVGLGIFLAVLSGCGIMLYPVAQIENMLYRAMEQSVVFFSDRTEAIVENIYFSPWAFVPYLAGITLAFFAIHYRKAWTATLALSLVILAMAIAFGYQEKRPAAEVYALRTPGNTALVIQQGGKCYYFTSGDSTSARQTENVCHKFALHRGSRGLERLPASTSRIVLGDSTIIAILGDAPLPDIYSRADYLFVDRSFSGTGSDISMLRPDTVLFSSAIDKRRVRKLKREMPDTTPVIDLRTERWSHIKE